MGFYSSNREKAIELARKQVEDKWTLAEIRQYWTGLEDAFFANWVVTILRKGSPNFSTQLR
jgi:hypothetical protein